MVVVGLGPAGPELLTSATRDAIAGVPTRFVRTVRHPSATAVPEATSFDSIYERSGSLDEVYAAIVDALAEAALDRGRVLYAVPGSPLVAERTVELLRDDRRVEVQVLPALSFVDLAWDALGVDPLAAGVRLVDGRRFSVEAAGERGPLLVAQCDSRQVLSDIKLAVDTGIGAPDSTVTVLQRLGSPDQSVTVVGWDDLDRSTEPDHLTSLYVPRLAAPVAGEVARFHELVRDLRERCPWDREQTHRSLTRHLLEEAYEVLDAIAGLPGDDAYSHLEEELGDLLFQVVFHSTLAAESGHFTLADVARRVHDKLVHRHPHVFGDVEADTAGAVMTNWERIKQEEKGRSSVMDGIPSDLPALLYAQKVQRKAEAVGVDVGEAAAADASDASDDSDAHDVARDLFAVVAGARRRGVDAEAALRSLTSRLRRQVEEMESARRGDG